MANINQISYWLEYNNGKSKESFKDETYMIKTLKQLIKSGIKPKIIDLSKQNSLIIKNNS